MWDGFPGEGGGGHADLAASLGGSEGGAEDAAGPVHRRQVPPCTHPFAPRDRHSMRQPALRKSDRG